MEPSEVKVWGEPVKGREWRVGGGGEGAKHPKVAGRGRYSFVYVGILEFGLFQALKQSKSFPYGSCSLGVHLFFHFSKQSSKVGQG